MQDSLSTLLNAREIWRQVCAQLQMQLSPAVFNTWIVANNLIELRVESDTTLRGVICSPTAFHSVNVKKNFYDQLLQSLQTITGKEVVLDFKVGMPPVAPTQTPFPPSSQSFPNHRASTSVENIASTSPTLTESQPNNQFQPLAQNQQGQSGQNSYSHNFSTTTPTPLSPRVENLFSESSLAHAAANRSVMLSHQAHLKPDFIFETFAVSTTNEMAHAAAIAVSKRPGTAYNPLFLYGGVGVGKTHLMHAIGNNILKNNPQAKVLYCTGEEFTNEIVSAIQTKKALKFKEKYRNISVFLLDDVQFIAGKNAVQEEFFHTFNSIIQQTGQIILTSDRPPHEINLLEDRLQSRFEAGLMIDIQAPSFELRTAILLIKAKANNLAISMELAQAIAAKVESARKIEGMIKKLRSAVELQQKSINRELVDSLLESERTIVGLERLHVKPADIIKTVADHYHIKQLVIRGKKRVKNIVRARHVAMFLMKEELQLPYAEIGRWFSNRDHTTAMHGILKITDELENDSQLNQEVSAIRMSLVSVSG